MKLREPLLRIAPKPLKTVNIDFAGREPLPVVNPQMAIAAKHQRIIPPELIGIDDRPPTYHFYGHIHQRFGAHVLNHLDLDDAISLENTEDGRLAGGASASLSFTSPAEVTLVDFDLSGEEVIGVTKERHPYNGDRLEHRGIAQGHLLGDPPCGHLHLEELDDPEPRLKGNLDQIYPPPGEVMEGVAAPLTAVSFTENSIDFSAPATCTKNEAIFYTRFFKEQSRFFLGFPYELECLYLHDTILFWCQIFYNHLFFCRVQARLHRLI